MSKITVGELLAKAPLAEIHELNPECRYIILMPMESYPVSLIEDVVHWLNKSGVRFIVIKKPALRDGLQIFELEKTE